MCGGPEVVLRALLGGIVGQGVGTALSQPGEPWRTGAPESFYGSFQEE
jgi:hypothetical protein